MLLAGLMAVAGRAFGAAESPAPKPKAGPACPPIVRLVWQAPQRVTWQLGETPLWYSLGHQSRVICFIPVGVEQVSGKAVETLNGSGTVYAVRLELHDVVSFEPGTPVPRETKLVRSETIRADDPKARDRKTGWGFPSEQGKDFEFGLLPPLEHQSLFRIYRHDDSQIWSTLMVHTEALTAEMPAELAAAAGSKLVFKDFLSYTVVCELLNDPALKTTSTYIEPDDPPSTDWIAKESVPAPWSAGKAVLEPARGSLEFEGGKMRFTAFSERAKRAAEEIARLKKGLAVPNQSLEWGGAADKADVLGLDADPATEGH